MTFCFQDTWIRPQCTQACSIELQSRRHVYLTANSMKSSASSFMLLLYSDTGITNNGPLNWSKVQGWQSPTGSGPVGASAQAPTISFDSDGGGGRGRLPVLWWECAQHFPVFTVVCFCCNVRSDVKNQSDMKTETWLYFTQHNRTTLVTMWPQAAMHWRDKWIFTTNFLQQKQKAVGLAQGIYFTSRSNHETFMEQRREKKKK